MKEAEGTVSGDERDAPTEILIVGGEPDLRARLVSRLQDRAYRCTQVGRLDEARSAVARRRHDLILLNPALPDGDGLDLARQVQSASAATRTIVFSDQGSFQHALSALRSGAIDFIRTPLDLDEFVERVDAALLRTASGPERERRLERLRRVCRDLHTAREDITGRVDALCYDMVHAYRDLHEQINEAAMASEFRTLLRQELDLEEALRTTLEYILSKTGPTNAAVFLPDGESVYSLGAYVNYDCPRQSIDELLDHLCEAICPQMSAEADFVAFDDAGEFAAWIGLEENVLADAQVIAFSCRHENECLAIVVLFRSTAHPFDPKLARTLDILRTIFAEQLTQIINVHHRASPEWPGEPDDYDDYGFGLGGLAA